MITITFADRETERKWRRFEIQFATLLAGTLIGYWIRGMSAIPGRTPEVQARSVPFGSEQRFDLPALAPP